MTFDKFSDIIFSVTKKGSFFCRGLQQQFFYMIKAGKASKSFSLLFFSLVCSVFRVCATGSGRHLFLWRFLCLPVDAGLRGDNTVISALAGWGEVFYLFAGGSVKGRGRAGRVAADERRVRGKYGCKVRNELGKKALFAEEKSFRERWQMKLYFPCGKAVSGKGQKKQ